MEYSKHLEIRRNGKPFCSHDDAKLVRWSERGYIKWQCAICGESKVLTESEFQSFEHGENCTECGEAMYKDTLDDKNYGYKCSNCENEIKLGALLPPAER